MQTVLSPQAVTLLLTIRFCGDSFDRFLLPSCLCHWQPFFFNFFNLKPWRDMGWLSAQTLQVCLWLQVLALWVFDIDFKQPFTSIIYRLIKTRFALLQIMTLWTTWAAHSSFFILLINFGLNLLIDLSSQCPYPFFWSAWTLFILFFLVCLLLYCFSGV